MKKPPQPIKITICPPAFAAPCSATLSPDHAAAIRAHNDALEARYQENATVRRMPINYGKRVKKSTLWPKGYHTPLTIYTVDIMDGLPDGLLNG